MAKVTIPELVIRTTADNPGYVHGLAVGAGSSLDSAVEELMTEAQRQAGELAREYQDGGQDDTEWAFQVVDVRLTTGPIGGPAAEAWVAYGTPVSDGRTPWAQGSYWDRDRR
jgi:hypothetical protein